MKVKDRYYISGPMTGLPDYNYPAFEQAAARLRAMGLHIESPHENVIESKYEKDEATRWRRFMVKAIVQMIDCNNIVLLPGWSKSKGARAEAELAITCGHRVYYYRKGLKRPLLEIQ